MPISYHVHGQADPFFITPCPFINLNKKTALKAVFLFNHPLEVNRLKIKVDY